MARGRGSRSAPGNETTRWRAPRIGVVLLALSLLFFGVNFTQEWWVSHQLQQDVASLQQQIRDTQAQNAQYQRDIAYYKSKAYITRDARQIGMARSGDSLLMFTQQPPRTRVVHVYEPAPAQQNILTRLLHAIFQ